MIKITNEYIDKLGASEVTKTLLKKEFTCKTSYWLARIFNEIEISSKIFISEKQRIVDKYAKKDEGGKIIQTGDSVTILDIAAFQKELTELFSIEIDFQINKIIFDIEKEPNCTIEEMSLLLPLVEVENAGD